MSDVFAQNWLKRVKIDPVMNAILNSKEKWIRYNTRTYEEHAPGNFREVNPPVRVARVEERYNNKSAVATTETFAERPRAGVLRHGDAEIFYRENPNNYWENKVPASFYGLKSINTLHNPYISLIKNKSISKK